MIQITRGSKGRGFRGIVLDRVVTRNRKNDLKETWVIGYCTDFEGRDEVKEFCQQRGGNWDAHERMWLIPLEPGDKMMNIFWDLSQEAIASFGEYMQMGGINISVEANFKEESLASVISWLKRKASKAHLALVKPEAQGQVVSFPDRASTNEGSN
jgi:hypothetical protein